MAREDQVRVGKEVPVENEGFDAGAETQNRCDQNLSLTYFLFPPFATVACLSCSLPFVWLHLWTSHDGRSIDHAV